MPQKNSKLIIVGGTMFAGKTTWLINYAASLEVGSFQLYKPNMDKRYGGNAFITHDGRQHVAHNLDVNNPKFPIIKKNVKLIIIDELNFFNSQILISEIQSQKNMGRSIVGAGLYYDHKKMPFGATLSLKEIADESIQLYAKCDQCGDRAEHVYRKVQSKERIILGAKDLYIPCCSKCWDLYTYSTKTHKYKFV